MLFYRICIRPPIEALRSEDADYCFSMWCHTNQLLSRGHTHTHSLDVCYEWMIKPIYASVRGTLIVTLLKSDGKTPRICDNYRLIKISRLLFLSVDNKHHFQRKCRKMGCDFIVFHVIFIYNTRFQNALCTAQLTQHSNLCPSN